MMALSNWTTAEPVPTEVIAKLPLAMMASEQSLKPVSRRAFIVTLDRLIAYVEQMGLVPLPNDEEKRRDWVRNTRDIYYTAFSDVPEDLFDQAVTLTIRTHRYSKMPLPGEMRAKVEAELSDRKNLATKIKTAVYFAQRQGQQAPREAHKPRTEAEKQAVAEAAAKAKAILDNAKIQRVPTQAGDHRTPTADPYRAAYAFIKRTGDE